MATKKVNKASFQFGGQTISLSKSKTQAAVRYTPGMKPVPKRRAATAAPEQIRDYEVVTAKRGIDQKLDALRAKPEVSVGTHIWFVDGDEDSPFIPTGYLYIEFKEGTAQEKQQEVLDEFKLSVSRVVGPEAYRVSTTPDSPNPVKCAMLLQKKRIVKIAEPDFMTKPVTGDFSPPSGKFINSQWHHENSGGQIPIIDIPNAVFGTSHFRKGADAKVRAAWEELQGLGSKAIKIAVIDTGFDCEHPSLRGDGTKIRNTFNAGNRTADVSPWFQAQDGSWGVFSHGTSCAAVAAGAWDSQGVLGAAPNARIIPIKLDILSDDAIQKALEHALLNGADIITCSLGFPKPVPLSTYVSNYISRVVREGRNGKGLPIFMAAGNANPASNNVPRQVSDFAAHPDVMCITASNSLDESSSYTFFGPNAFLCAPTNGNDGVGITTATVRADGDSLEHVYTSRFGGTSSSTPLAAGVCALLLSANPDLTLSEIRDILRRSADKIGSGYDANGRSPKLGYGRLNALRAVQMASGGSGSGSAGNNNSGSGQGGGTGTGGGGQTATQRGKVTSKFLNVRTGPGTSNPKVAELQKGDIVNLFEKVGGFWRVGNGQFASADFIQVIATNGAPAAGTRKGKVTSSFLNVRTGPGTSNAKVGELKKGATVSIFETSSNGWHRIGDKRWVIGSNVQEA
ncbi:MAG: S8 family serine peptidase [Saprospiraceae bacterium]